MKPINGKITPCCSKVGMKKGPWTAEEDDRLSEYVKKEGEGRWRTLPKRAGLLRCGKSCRLRWMNYLRPSVKRGRIAPDEEDLILRLHRLLGNRWSLIAGRLPGRTDNEIKNYWNTHLRKKLISQGIDPRTHKLLNPNEKNTEASPPSNTTEKMWMPSRIGQATSPADITSERNPNSKYASTICTGMSKQERNGLLDVEEVGLCAEDVFTSFFDSIINEEEAFSCGSSQHLPGNGKSSEGLVSAATQHGS